MFIGTSMNQEEATFTIGNLDLLYVSCLSCCFSGSQTGVWLCRVRWSKSHLAFPLRIPRKLTIPSRWQPLSRQPVVSGGAQTSMSAAHFAHVWLRQRPCSPNLRGDPTISIVRGNFWAIVCGSFEARNTVRVIVQNHVSSIHCNPNCLWCWKYTDYVLCCGIGTVYQSVQFR